MEAFFGLLKTSIESEIELSSHIAFAKMMKYHEKSDYMFKIIAPEIEEHNTHMIVPHYSEKEGHWNFIIVDLARTFGKPKVYLVDSVVYYQKQHKQQLIKKTNRGPSWCDVTKRWLRLQLKGSIKGWTFEVLPIKNQDNNYDCGLLVCLLIWQFYMTIDVKDVVSFPWHANYS